MKYLVLLFIMIILLPHGAAAHVLDEYVQTAQITLSPTAVNINLRLTPGVDVADRVFRLIDLDRNGQLSTAEQQTYTQRVLHDLALELNGHSLPLTLTSSAFPSRSEIKTGDAPIRLDLSASAPLNVPGDHQLTFRNNHLPRLSVYNANTLIPATNSISITSQQRDPLQHDLKLDFRITPFTVTRITTTRPLPLWQIVTWLCQILI